MRRLGLNTSDIGYFLYCDGDRFTEQKFLHKGHATMQFKVSLLAYRSDLSWIEPTLKNIKQLLNSKELPGHAENCEYGIYLAACKNIYA